MSGTQKCCIKNSKSSPEKIHFLTLNHFWKWSRNTLILHTVKRSQIKSSCKELKLGKFFNYENEKASEIRVQWRVWRRNKKIVCNNKEKLTRSVQEQKFVSIRSYLLIFHLTQFMYIKGEYKRVGAGKKVVLSLTKHMHIYLYGRNELNESS